MCVCVCVCVCTTTTGISKFFLYLFHKCNIAMQKLLKNMVRLYKFGGAVLILLNF